MPLRRLGRTGLKVSQVGMGGMGVLAAGHASADAAAALVTTALDEGIRFFDTARSYFDSEKVFGRVLAERASECVIATKSYARSAARMEKEIRASLDCLRVKKIHLYQCHHVQYPSEFERIVARAGALAALQAAQREGVIDFIGISSHNPRLIKDCIATGYFDTVQVPLSPAEREHFDSIRETAVRLDLGVIAMKPLAGGNLKSVEAALRYVLSHDEVSTVIPGASALEHVKLDARVGRQFVAMSDEERRAVVEEAGKLPDLFCRRCRYCEAGCAAKLPISDIFRCEDYLILNATYAREQFRSLGCDVGGCTDCGQCEKICPYGLPIRQRMKTAQQRLTRGRIEDLAVRLFHRLGVYDIARKLYFDLGGRLPKR